MAPSRLALRGRKEKTSEELERLHREWQLAQQVLSYEEANIKVLEGKQAIYTLLILAHWINKQK